MKKGNLEKAIAKNREIEKLANAITALEISEDIQVRIFTATRSEYVLNAFVAQDDLKRVLLVEAQKTLVKFQAELKELGVED